MRVRAARLGVLKVIGKTQNHSLLALRLCRCHIWNHGSSLHLEDGQDAEIVVGALSIDCRMFGTD